MTKEMQDLLDRQMDDALAVTDKETRHDAILTCLACQSKALIDCQRKTSDRVKILVDDVDKIKSDLASCVESDKDYRANKQRAAGAMLLWKVLKYLTAGGAGAALLGLLQH